jgi:hypothetical protein
MKTKRVLSERAIDTAARRARDQILERFKGVLPYDEWRVVRRLLGTAIFHDIGDSVRLNSKFEPRGKR